MFIVRQAAPEDESAAKVVSRLAYRALQHIYRPSATARAQRANATPQYTMLVGEYEGRIVATVEYLTDAINLHIRGLAVDPAFQRRGIARQMIDELVSIARKRRRSAVTLYTIRETGNVRVFEKLGFHVVGEEVASWCESDRFDELHETKMKRPVT